MQIQVNESTFRFADIATQAAGSVLLQSGETTILATVARDEVAIDADFTPLTVQYLEKQYAVGKIPGGYIKRETKPGDFETLTSRIIDRSLRPLFPKGYAYQTQITLFVLSASQEADLQVLALNAASAALFLSDIPVKKAVCGVRVGCVEGELVLNPSNSVLAKSSLDLYVAGVGDELLMIEMRALGKDGAMNEMSEAAMCEAIEFAKEAIERTSSEFAAAFEPHAKEVRELVLRSEACNESAIEFIRQNYAQEVKDAINKMAKSERAVELNLVFAQIQNDERAAEFSEAELKFGLERVKREMIRSQIINEGVRADGRGLAQVRPIWIETNILPNAHGSCLFTRGQTQALVVATLGSDADAQLSDLLTQKSAVCERFMFNYNFPGFSVGEASMIKAPGRRELGHGNLAKRALAPSLPESNPFVVRVVSEILESNGSSSMASVCGGALALRAAGVKTHKLVAGVAMGLVFEGEKHAVLTDIMGLEDHDGDMDFKVAGSKDGITALQMDIKLGGISPEVLSEALLQAKAGREHILALMEEAASKIAVNEAILPKIELFKVSPSKVGEIIGQGGKTIKEIIEKFGVTIDIGKDNGSVKVVGVSAKSVDEAREFILNLVENSAFGGRGGRKPRRKIQVGETFESSVKNVTAFGAFVGLEDGIDGLLHISKIRNTPLNPGDAVKVVVVEVKGDKISLDLVKE